MRIPLPQLREHPQTVMRRVGYAPYRSREGAESYIRRLHGTLYPRFHAYLETSGTGMTLNLHLDAKQPSYAGKPAHAGEYEGTLVEQEAARIRGLLID